MSAYQRNTIVGAVVLIGLGILAWMVLQFANRAASFFLTTGTPITLTTGRADGVAEGSPVTYRGVSVGRVTAVRRVANMPEGADIVIDALIEADPPLPANLEGRIKQTSLLGASATITLEPGPDELDPASRPATTNASTAGLPLYLVEGANLRAEYVPDITSLGDNIRGLTTSIQGIIGDPKVKDDIHVSLANIRATTESAKQLGARLEKLSDRLDQIAEESSGTMSEAHDTVKDVRATVKDAGAMVNDGRAELRRFSANLNQRMEQVALSLQHVQSVARKIDQGKGTAGQLINDPKLYESLADTAAEMNLMVKDMRRLIQQWEQEGIIKL
jgi:phospholipid/cholesterol/gamma-HCH transport system substrate-binding protein